MEGVYLPPLLYLNAKLDENLMWVISDLISVSSIAGELWRKYVLRI